MHNESRGGRAVFGAGLLIWVGWMAWPSSAPLRERASLPKAFTSGAARVAAPQLAAVGGLPGPRVREYMAAFEGPEQTADREASNRASHAEEAATYLKEGNFFHATEAYLKILATDANSVVALRGLQAVRSGATSPDTSLEGDPTVLRRNLLDELSREAEEMQSAGRFQEAVNAANLFFRLPNEDAAESERVRSILVGSQMSLQQDRVSAVQELTGNVPGKREPAEEID